MTEKIRLGISACLLGQEVRYDGQHKRDAFLVDTLGRYVEYVPVCPEVECGLGVPRESMHLEGSVEAPRLVTTKTGIDHTERMLSWAQMRIAELEREGLRGFIFKSKSPSSGMERVKVYNGKGGFSGVTSGLFAGAFQKAFPLLPVEEEGRLHDENLRENFIERIFALDRYRKGPGTEGTPKSLMRFQATHKLLIMSHQQQCARELGRLAASAQKRGFAETLRAYEDLLLRTLCLKATPAKHTNVLQHIQGYFKEYLGADEKRELGEIVSAYRAELVPLVVPVTLLRHYTRKYDVEYLKGQVYLDPHPLELKLRNHA